MKVHNNKTAWKRRGVYPRMGTPASQTRMSAPLRKVGQAFLPALPVPFFTFLSPRPKPALSLPNGWRGLLEVKNRFLAWLGMTMETLGQSATLFLNKVRKRCEVYPRMGTPALLSLVFLCVLCASVVSPASAQTTITGTVKDASGTVLSSGTIIFTLSQEGIVSDPALLITPPVTCTITAGVIQSCSLRGNDEISPAGTVYRVRITSSGGRTFLPERTYSITGATWDIGTQTPNPSSVQDGIHGASLHSGDVIPPANQNFGAFYFDFAQIAVPANPASGTRRLFVDSATGEVSVRTSAGSTVSLEAAGGGGGATHQIDGVGLTSQDPINFLDTSEFDWTNPAAGNYSLALKSDSVADSKLASNYSGVGICTNQFVRATVDNAAPTCESIAEADLPSTNALDTELHAQSYVLAGSDHTASGLTTGNVVRATGATAFAWQQLGFSDLGGSATDAQVPNTITLDNLTQITTRNYSDLQNRSHGASDHTGDVIPAANQNFDAFYSDFGEIAAPANPSAGVVRVYAKTGSGELCSRDSAGTENCMSTGAGGANHNILSSTHSDTTAAAVVRGDLMVGQTATPV